MAPGALTLGFDTAVLTPQNNPNDYLLLPQVLTLGWYPWGEIGLGSGGFAPSLLFSAEVIPYIDSPENLWVGGLFGFGFQYRPRASAFAFFLQTQGGVGAIDSTDVKDAQGQDLTFTFLGTAGLRVFVARDVSLSLGLMYQHISNGGLSEPERPNVGLDSFGPVLGVRWEF